MNAETDLCPAVADVTISTCMLNNVCDDLIGTLGSSVPIKTGKGILGSMWCKYGRLRMRLSFIVKIQCYCVNSHSVDDSKKCDMRSTVIQHDVLFIKFPLYHRLCPQVPKVPKVLYV